MQRKTEMEESEEKIRAMVTVADEYRKEISERKDVIDTENHELLTTEHGLKQLRDPDRLPVPKDVGT